VGDIEGAVRTALRADTAVAALVGTRVLFGVPSNATWPLIVVRRVGGGDDLGEAPIDLPLLQIDCWGAERNKAQARAVADAVRDWCRSIRRATDLNTEVTAYGINVESDLWAPDDTDRPRYVLTASVMSRNTQAA
jgi:hypothetical protein